MMRQLVVMALISLIILVFPVAYCQFSFDSAPIVVMLMDALSDIYAGNFDSAILISNTALRVNVPSDLSYLHVKAWRILRDLSRLLSQAANESRVEVEFVYRIYRLKVECELILPDYAEELIRRISSFPTRIMLKNSIESYLDELSPCLDELIGEVLTGLDEFGMHLVLSVPDVVEAGGILNVSFSLPLEAYVYWVRVVIRLGIHVNSTLIYLNRTVRDYSFNLILPGTESGVYVGVENPLDLQVVLTGIYNESEFYAASRRTLNVLAFKPPIYFRIPARISPGENLNLTVDSRVDFDLPSQITIVDVEGGLTVFNESFVFKPGLNNLVLNTSSLNLGIYTLTIRVFGRGKFLSATYSKGFSVLGSSLGVEVGFPKLVLGPPFMATINLRLPDELSFSRIIVRSGSEVLVDVNSTGGNVFSVLVPLGGVILAGFKSITIEIVPFGGEAIGGRVTVNLFALNLLSTIIAIIFALTFASVSAQGLTLYFNYLTNILRRIGGAGGGIAFKTFTSIYFGLISLLARYVEPPRFNETLREYYARASRRLEGLSDSLWRFIVAYERYLYSLRKPKLGDLKRIYDEIAGWFR